MERKTNFYNRHGDLIAYGILNENGTQIDIYGIPSGKLLGYGLTTNRKNFYFPTASGKAIHFSYGVHDGLNLRIHNVNDNIIAYGVPAYV